MVVYFNGEFLAKEAVSISPDDRGFLLADGVYEVIRAYEGKLFQAEAHLQRMARSMRELHLSGPSPLELNDVAERLIMKNNLTTGGATVYLQITRGAAPRRHAFPADDTPPTVYATASPSHPSVEKMTHGIKVILVPDMRWTRCDIKSISLLPNVLANQQAKERQVEEAVFVRDGAVTEGSHTNVGAVFKGTIVTYPKSHYILSGITRQVVIELCHQLNIPVKEFPILVDHLPKADEMMLMSTTSEITPIVQVDDWTVGNGKPGPVTVRLQQAFQELTR
jgi:D-alanine transaminase